jgi:hypothetical protein
MGARVYFVSGIVFLLCAFILSLLVTISLSDTRASSLLLPTLTILLILFFQFASVRSLVFGEKERAVPLSIELTRRKGGHLHI